MWASSILDSWIQYHTTRHTLLTPAPPPPPPPPPLYSSFFRNSMKPGVDWQGMMASQDPHFGQTDDMCQVTALQCIPCSSAVF